MSGEKKVFDLNGVRVKLYAPRDLSKNWFFEWYAPDRRRKYGPINRQKTYETRMAAADAYAKVLAQEMLPVKSVAQVRMEEYVDQLAVQLRPSTMVNIRGIVAKLFEWLDGRELNREALEAFFQDLQRDRHNTTYNIYRSWLLRIFEGIEAPGMFVNIPRLKTQKTPARYFQPHQVEQLRDVIGEEDPELWLYIQFVFYCFIRPSRELPHIKAGNIMLDDREILVWASHSKNKKTQYVSIPDAFLPALEFVYDLGPDQYLFPSRWDVSKPIGRNTMSRKHREILRRLNYGKGYCLYSWKHTGAIHAIKAGISVKELQVQLRHHSLTETDKYLRQLGVRDISNFRQQMPDIHTISRKKRPEH